MFYLRLLAKEPLFTLTFVNLLSTSFQTCAEKIERTKRNSAARMVLSISRRTWLTLKLSNLVTPLPSFLLSLTASPTLSLATSAVKSTSSISKVFMCSLTSQRTVSRVSRDVSSVPSAPFLRTPRVSNTSLNGTVPRPLTMLVSSSLASSETRISGLES